MGTVLLVTAALLVVSGVTLVRRHEPVRTARPVPDRDRPARYGPALLVGLLAVLLLGAAVAYPML